MSIMDQVKQNLREWYSLAADRTSEMTKISVRMYDKYGISREIERQLSELGGLVFHAAEAGRTDFAADEAFGAAIQRIRELQHDLLAKVEEIDSIRQQRQQKTAARQATAPDQAGAAGAEDEAFPEGLDDLQSVEGGPAGGGKGASQSADAGQRAEKAARMPRKESS